MLHLRAMGITYFKRYRMESSLSDWQSNSAPNLPPDYFLVPFAPSLIREHAQVKFNSFREELDAIVFPCLSNLEGCLRLMKEISNRSDFVPGATWLIRHRIQTEPDGPVHWHPVGTIQGLSIDGWGAIQNLGIDPDHRGKGLGSVLLANAASGFRALGLPRMHLEVTTENEGAIRLYHRKGFRRTKIVYKAADVAGARECV